jgi:hypothetical protein
MIRTFLRLAVRENDLAVQRFNVAKPFIRG